MIRVILREVRRLKVHFHHIWLHISIIFIRKSLKNKSVKKKITNPTSNMNLFNKKKNSVDSVGNSIGGPYLSPFFSSRDGRPSTILKHHDIPTSMQIDMNSAISLLQHNNMVTVDSSKANKKLNKVVPLKERLSQKQSK